MTSKNNKKLVIVESPTKSKSISRFLGEGFEVDSSYGHVRDLPKKKLGVDIENNFDPQYVVPKKAKKQIKQLKDKLKESDSLILATDEDREGESIAYHLKELLGIDNPERIVFHEITEPAIKEAIKNPRDIDMNLVHAQQARRILDRLVGYKLSPFLWKKVARGLSAGRVQSVALKLIAEREEEIKKHNPKEYWTIEAVLKKKNESFSSKLIKEGKDKIKKFDIKNKKQADRLVSELKNSSYEVKNIERKEKKKNPIPPFTTSTLQRDAARRFNFSAKKTMTLAQNLYERGFITYHRTDSVNLSSSSLEKGRQLIKEKYGTEYLPKSPKRYKTKSKGAQEAHEAIRPTDPIKTPENIKDLKKDYQKLYRLIWQRFIGSQMKAAIIDAVKIDIKAGKYTLRSNGQTIKFDGFSRAYKIKFKEEEMPKLEKGENLSLEKLNPEQHFTKPPARYSEASLVKTLEKEGIGRPSTYAMILDTIQRRNYARKNKENRFQPTEMGMLINRILVKHFPKIVDTKFTANMEEELDEIAAGKEEWRKVVADFYGPFSKNLEKKDKELDKKDFMEKTEKKCPECGAPVVLRWGRYGKFYSCSNFPECKYKKSMPKPKLGIKCPNCKKGEIVEKRTRRGKIFYGCNRWPECDNAYWDKPIEEKCPKCGALLVEKKTKIKCSNKECNFEK